MEFVVFGKGVGESILIMTDDLDYFVIDSYINNETNRPIVLDYLEEKELSPKNIKGVIVTHIHDDHIKGISEIIEESSDDVIVYLNRIITSEKYLVKASEQMLDYNCEELRLIFQLINKGRCRLGFASENKRIYQSASGDTQIYTLTPFDDTYNIYFDKLEKECKKLIYKNFDNLSSIVLKVVAKDNSFLFGSDLETIKDGVPGWEKITANYQCGDPNIKYFKVPHHGSENGYYDDFWNKYLKWPRSIITRYNRSHLPKKDILDIIKEKSVETFVVGHNINLTSDTKLLEALTAVNFMNNNNIKYTYCSKKTNKNYVSVKVLSKNYHIIEKKGDVE